MKNKKILSYILVFLFTFSFIFTCIPQRKANASVVALATSLGLSTAQANALFSLGISAGATYLTVDAVERLATVLYNNVSAVKSFVDNVQDGVTTLTYPQSLLATTYNYMNFYNSNDAYVRYATYTYNNNTYTIPFTVAPSDVYFSYTTYQPQYPFISTTALDLGFTSYSFSPSRYSDNSNDYDTYGFYNALMGNTTMCYLPEGTCNFQYVYCLANCSSLSSAYLRPYVVWQDYNKDYISANWLPRASTVNLSSLPIATQNAITDALSIPTSTDFDRDIAVTPDLTFSEDREITYCPDITDITEYVNTSTVPTGNNGDDNNNNNGNIDLTLPVDFALDFSPLLVAGQTLATKFPFSLPWDIYNILSLFNSPAVAPSFTIDFPSNIFGSAGSITLDFSYFSTLATMVRYCITIIFTIWLIIATKNLI